MAEITEQVGQQVLKLGGKFIQGTAEFIAELMEALEKNKMDDPNKWTMADHMKKGGQVYTSFVKNDIANDLAQALAEQNVPFVFLDNGDGDNVKTLLIRDTDKTKAEFATKLVMNRKNALVEFEKDEFVNITPAKKLACVSGLSAHEYELFREKAKANGLEFAATVGANNKINILYNVDNKEKLNASMRAMAWDLTGRNGQVYERAYKTKIEAQEHIRMMHKKQGRNIFLVDAHQPDLVMKVTKTHVMVCQHYDHNLSVEANFENAAKLSVNETKYIPELGQMLSQFKEPVVLREQDLKDRKTVIQKKLPKLDAEWHEKENVFYGTYDQLFKENGHKIEDYMRTDPEFKVSEYVIGEIRDEHMHFERGERKELEEHVIESTAKTRVYAYYEPQTNSLLKHLEEVKQRRTISQVERQENTREGKKVIKETTKEEKREKKSVRDR